jgi:hypothetical protein
VQGKKGRGRPWARKAEAQGGNRRIARVGVIQAERRLGSKMEASKTQARENEARERPERGKRGGERRFGTSFRV